MSIRPLIPSEYQVLQDFLYDAIYIPEGMERPPHEIIRIPELRCYYEDFGKETDYCLIAEEDGLLAGAVWVRLFAFDRPGFGYYNASTPEISMSVKAEFRNHGIGTALLTAMLEKMEQKGIAMVSLSVDLDNYAFRMYRKFGFEVVKDDGKSATMVWRSKPILYF